MLEFFKITPTFFKPRPFQLCDQLLVEQQMSPGVDVNYLQVLAAGKKLSLSSTLRLGHNATKSSAFID